MSGRIGTAPCGHRGEAIIGQYYRCLLGCDSRPADEPELEFTLVVRTCPACKSSDLDYEFELDPEYYTFHPNTPVADYDTRCNDCGRCWIR